jgi:hypothetical protein
MSGPIETRDRLGRELEQKRSASPSAILFVPSFRMVNYKAWVGTTAKQPTVLGTVDRPLVNAGEHHFHHGFH